MHVTHPDDHRHSRTFSAPLFRPKEWRDLGLASCARLAANLGNGIIQQTPRRSTVAAIIGGYNLVQNLALPTSLYVPANVVVSAGLLALARRSGCSWDDLGLDPRRAEAGVHLGLVACGAVAVGAAGALSHPSLRRFLLDQRAAKQQRGDVLFHTLVRFPLGTALFEEVAFRGVVEGIWRRSGATEREAAYAAAALFGLWHLIPTRDAMEGSPLAGTLGSDTSRAGAVLAGAVATAAASLGFSWLRRRSGSLLAPWLAHTAVSCGGYLAGVVVWRRHAGRLPVRRLGGRRLRKSNLFRYVQW